MEKLLFSIPNFPKFTMRLDTGENRPALIMKLIFESEPVVVYNVNMVDVD
jgi:hypothetical protein